MQYVGKGAFPHPSNSTLPHYNQVDDITGWFCEEVLDFGNGFVALVEIPWVTREGGSAAEPEEPQFRITIIKVTDPSEPFLQEVITLPMSGPVTNYVSHVSSLALSPERVLVVVNGPEYQTMLSVFSFDGATLSVGEWTTRDAHDVIGTIAWYAPLLAKNGDVWLVGWNLGVYLARVTVQGRGAVTIGEWAEIKAGSDTTWTDRWKGRMESAWTLVGGAVRGFLWLLSPGGGTGTSLHMVSFRVDGGGWSEREIDPETSLVGLEGDAGGYVPSLVNSADVTEIVYFKHLGFGAPPHPGWESGDDGIMMRVARVWSDGSEIDFVRKLKPTLVDGEAGLISRAMATGRKVPTGGSSTTIPHPVAYSNNGGMQHQMGLYRLPQVAATPKISSGDSTTYLPPDAVVAVTGHFLVAINGGSWTDYDDPSSEPPTSVYVFHWTPEGDLEDGSQRIKGYFS